MYGPQAILSISRVEWGGRTNLSDGELLCPSAKLVLQRLRNLDQLEAAEEAKNKIGKEEGL